MTVSSIVPFVCGIHKQLKVLQGSIQTPLAKNFLVHILTNINNRLADYERRSLPRLATIIDPRYKKKGFLKDVNYEEGKKLLKMKYAEMVISNGDVINQQAQASNLSSSCIDQSKNIHKYVNILFRITVLNDLIHETILVLQE